MKKVVSFFLLLLVIFSYSQEVDDTNRIKDFNSSISKNDRISKAFLLSEYYLEADDIKASQKWLDITKDLVAPNQIDTITIFINSLQSELFYYEGLFQFGTNEAEKAIQNATEIRDSLLIANGYFFKGVNQIEMKNFKEAEKSLWASKKFQPQKKLKKHIRNQIENDHIYNNIALLKLKMNQSDSAVWYNSKAYQYALVRKSIRGIPNVEQAFGEIYLHKKMVDSAIYYFNKSVSSAQKRNYHDIVLLNYGFLMQCYKNNALAQNEWFDKGIALINDKNINATYQRYFFKIAQSVFSESKQINHLVLVQEKIIAADDQTKTKDNLYIQNITEQYTKNETKLLKFQLAELKKQRNFTILQLIAAILFVGILLLIIIIIRRKNKTQEILLVQKNEISKDLHDDIGSGLSSILIHADLLLKNPEINDRQKTLTNKINFTGREIAQRLNTFIWSLNDEQDTLQHFSEYVNSYGSSLFEETTISFSFHSTIPNQESIRLNGQQRKNLFYAIKEVCNNALKHSCATKMEINIELISSKQMQIVMHDNGLGNAKETTFGNGIKNINKRVNELNGVFKMTSENGLLTTITIPI